ncbi:methylated-DNA--[protein]-cysteine S-methyltransferase [Parasutterella excrementihominis]|uniref:methylated-DNA--[protein]-cysteine S-methyltransferase n=1 Tax=Parasutterella excrementihominis TaxID=487175 RepID=UPI003F591F89
MRKRPQITTSEAIEPIYISKKRLPCGGALTLGSWNNRLVVADWIDGWHHSTIMNRLQKYTKASVVKSTSKVIEAASDWLDAYFEGSKEAPDFDLLFLGTDFQKRVWQLLLEIPYGETITYGELAQKAGTPKAARAIGVPSEIILSPSSFPATASSAKISHSPVTAAVLMSKNICSHTNSAPISKIYLLATAQGALLDRHNKNFRSCNGT